MEPLVAQFFIDTEKTLRQWLQGLHEALNLDSLTLPDWCGEVTFKNLKRTVRDGELGKKLLALLSEMRQDKAEGGLPVIVFPPRQARPDLAMVLGRSILALVGCKMLEGRSNHSAQLGDNFDSTDVKQLWTKKGNVINAQLRNSALATVATSPVPVKLLRVGFNFAAKASGGGVDIEGQEIHVKITPPMLTAAFAGVDWTETAERLLFLSGIPPYVALLAEDAAAKIQCHIHGCGPAASAQWAKALPTLRKAYEAAGKDARQSVAGVLDIIDGALPDNLVRNALFQVFNVGVWHFGDFVFTPKAFVTFTVLSSAKRAAAERPRSQRLAKRVREH